MFPLFLFPRFVDVKPVLALPAAKFIPFPACDKGFFTVFAYTHIPSAIPGKLKRAGALCFYRNPEKIIGGCYVKIGKFDSSELLYQDEVRGSLLILADRVIDLIYLKYLKAAISYYKETRVET